VLKIKTHTYPDLIPLTDDEELLVKRNKKLYLIPSLDLEDGDEWFNIDDYFQQKYLRNQQKQKSKKLLFFKILANIKIKTLLKVSFEDYVIDNNL